jgi:succinoglycan biosynthesis transport protein ExoP
MLMRGMERPGRDRTTVKSPVSFEAHSEVDREPDLDVANVLRILLRRRYLLLTFVSSSLVLALLFLAVSKRRYRADAQLQVLTRTSDIGLQQENSGGADGALQLAITLDTYSGVLSSDNLALQVIGEQSLEGTAEYKIPSAEEYKREGSLPLEQTRFRREKMLERFKKNLTVSTIAGSRLIKVSFLSVDPARAKAVLSQLLRDFQMYNDTVRFRTSQETEDLLGKQLADLKKSVQQTQQHAAELQRETGIYGTDGTKNVVLSRLEALNQELVNAEVNRHVKEGTLRVLQGSTPEEMSNLSGASGQANVPTSVNSLALLQSLRQQEATLAVRQAELDGKYGANYPRVIETAAQLASVRLQIEHESQRLAVRAENDYKTAVYEENRARAEFEQQEQLANRANSVSAEYLIANREATSTRELYDHLQSKLKESGIAAGLHDANIDILDKPHVGIAPVSPNWPATLAAALGAGLVLGLCIVFLRDGLDRRLQDVEMLGVLSGGRTPQVVPLTHLHGGSLLDGASMPSSAFTEAFRVVRTLLLQTLPGSECKVLLVASPGRGEGKSTIALNLGEALALRGHRVLLIDADLRRRGLSLALGFESDRGLADILSGKGESPVRPHGGLSVMPAGSLTANGAELVSSDELGNLLRGYRALYDFIVVDTVALLPLSDTGALATHVDGIVLVARAGVTTKDAFKRGIQVLVAAGKPVVDTILNGLDVSAPEYTYFHGRPETDPASSASTYLGGGSGSSHGSERSNA